MPTRNSVCRAIITAATALFLTLGSARADDPQTLKDRLHAAKKDTSLDSSEVAPFYLKMSVQLFDAKGKPSEQGTIELYWAGIQRQKRIYSFPSFAATELYLGDKFFRTEKATYTPEMLDLLLDQTLHPMPRDEEIDPSEPVMQKIALGKTPLDCIMLASPLGGEASIPMGLFPTYCFGPNDNAFRVALRYGGQVVLRNSIGTFQGRHVATDLVVSVNNVNAAEGKIEKLEQRPITDSDLSSDGLSTNGLTPPGPDGSVRVSAGVIRGLAINQPPPVYPLSAKAKQLQGVVVLHAIIDKEGHIQQLRVLSSPDPDLTIAAIDAVRQWRFRPYLLMGNPVEVNTTININFAFDH